MIQRQIEPLLRKRLREEAAVVLSGPRQVGKTTLALDLIQGVPAGDNPLGIYLDLEAPSDRAKLADPELYLGSQTARPVVLDEVHRTPALFPVLRGLIDRARRRGDGVGLYLLLGSASFELLRQSGESLAGRVSYLELAPLTIHEAVTIPDDLNRLWLRGGFPRSYLARDSERSLNWRTDFISTYLERDIPLFGGDLPSEILRRLWTMLGHMQGGVLNVAQLSRNLGIDVRTVNRYIELMSSLLLLRRLPAWHGNIGKRLIKSPKVFLRDSGILHALFGIHGMEQLLSHPVVGASWEGFVIENVLSTILASGAQVEAFFYRTAGGAELDLLLCLPGGARYAFEIKRSLSPQPGRGFWSACEDLRPQHAYIVYPGTERYPISREVTALPACDLKQDVLLQIIGGTSPGAP